jgi:hypothetical protein
MKFLWKFSRSLIFITLVAGSVGVLAAQVQTPPAQTPPANPRPVRIHPKVAGFDLSPQAGKAPNQIGGASRDIGGSPALYAPAMAKAFSTQPTFYWSAGDAAQKVEFQLMSDKGATIFESSVTGSHFTYPADAPSLAPGATYRWTVKPEDDIMGGPPAPVDFVIVGGTERVSLAGELAAAGDAATRAKVFFDHRVWYDALSSYTDAIAAHPERKDLRRERAVLYDQLPATQSLADSEIAGTD